MEHRTIMITFLMAILILHQNWGSIAARPSRPPMMISTSTTIHPPAAIIPRGSLSKPKVVLPRPPSTAHGFTVNPYKMTDADAFRPTNPGPSPGVGNKKGAPPTP
ncbi:hypothetical protein I3843_12G052500 [Carya illinoinensis]|uniref:Uncharacterized protein n=1 Tax=Carya illinoinensis TaxID=32201 RepID=A0A8T1NWE1_CARIL|nr:hypothetical protein I3760_12G052200 [Carya illinoinensis]KAG6633514.1 hypothetical protein CIPAW_12G053100 [Carya illinoinensis]KAG6684215.1 hypothetical protein I3842_12G051700 [Carya illinoinensis]KAG7952302.1 hypothetical protein I3843_12G052500 [Carya illinoinensis]